MKKIFLDVGYVVVCNDHNLSKSNEIDEEFVSHRMTLAQEIWRIQDAKKEKFQGSVMKVMIMNLLHTMKNIPINYMMLVPIIVSIYFWPSSLSRFIF